MSQLSLAPSSDLAEALAESFPPLGRYCPILDTISVQQAAWLLLDEPEALYGGAAGGGKSDALLSAALQYVDVPGYAALILRRTFAQLEQPGMLIPRADAWLGGTDVRRSDSGKKWTFPSGAVLKFGHVKDEAAALNYQGGEYHFIGFDELTQFTQTQYTYIAFSRSRRTRLLADLGIPIRRRASANPGGIGHAWVKRRLVDAKTRQARAVFIPAKVQDNPGLDVVEYEESLAHLGPVLRAQLLDGDWGAFEGMAFERWHQDVHVVAPFPVPTSWERFESVDPGINNPTAWIAWAVDEEGNLLAFDSVYTDQGQGLPSMVAPAVLARRGYWRSTDAYTDPSAWNRTGALTRWGDPASLATEYEDAGVPLAKGNNDPRAGYTRLRELVQPDPKHRFPGWHPRARELGAPRLYVVGATCPELVEQLGSAPLQPIEKRLAGEIIDPDWEGAYGHAVASARYGVMSRPDPSPSAPPPPADERASLLQAVERKRNAGQVDTNRYQDI